MKNSKLVIGIDASRAFVKNKTGIEECSYQIIKHLRKYLKDRQVILYTRPGGDEQLDFDLPEKWQVKVLPWRYFWTQLSLSWELLLNPVDVLFVPAHTLPIVHPQKSVVIIHGLEYEFSPESYSFYSRLFHRFFIKKSCSWSSQIIAVSEKTKKDLNELYRVENKKMKIIPNGFMKVRGPASYLREVRGLASYLFYIGRLEERKNIVGIIEAFEILKKKYSYDGKLLLGGSTGHGYNEIKSVIDRSHYKQDIEELGFVKDEEKWPLLKNADIFMFPSHSEGFGIPILEAQSMATPVITSDRSPMEETVGDGRVLVNPDSPKNIAKVANKILQDETLQNNIIEQGLKNIKRFSWEKTAEKISKVLIEK